MSTKEYDIAIVGGSLAARVAATLLAKYGARVLFLRQREQTASSWFHSSLFLEQLLGVLGGRACFVTPKPFQVISEQARITLHNDTPLEDELNRELGSGAAAAILVLDRLRQIGEELEQLFWDNYGLPWPGVKNAARFRLLCIRHKLRRQEFELPLQQVVDRLDKPARTLLTDLFQGLAITPLSNLSLAQGALLWYHVSRPEDLAEPDFSTLLRKRFDQFHGAVDELEGLARLDFDAGRFTGGSMKTGVRFKARWFVLGDARWQHLFAAANPINCDRPMATTGLQTSALDGQLSPLLERQVIPGGPIPMRVSLETQGQGLYGRVVAAGHRSTKEVRSQLERILPFAKYELDVEAQAAPPVTTNSSQPGRSLFSLPLRLGSNLLAADDQALLPELGAAGAALLGWTIASQLAPEPTQRKQ